MTKYYFTFGSNHMLMDQLSLSGYHVEVELPTSDTSYGDARQLFCESFAANFTGAQNKWAFQYDQDSWDKIVAKADGPKYTYNGINLAKLVADDDSVTIIWGSRELANIAGFN